MLSVKTKFSDKKLIVLISLIIELSVPDLQDKCIDNCESTQLDCILSCDNDSACISECIRGSTSCIQGNFAHNVTETRLYFQIVHVKLTVLMAVRIVQILYVSARFTVLTY